MFEANFELELLNSQGASLGPFPGVTAGSLTGARNASIKWSGSLTYEGPLSRVELVKRRCRVWLTTGGTRLKSCEKALVSQARGTPNSQVYSRVLGSKTFTVAQPLRRQGRWLFIDFWAYTLHSSGQTNLSVDVLAPGGVSISSTPPQLECLDRAKGLLRLSQADLTPSPQITVRTGKPNRYACLVYANPNDTGIVQGVRVAASDVHLTTPRVVDVTPQIDNLEAATESYDRRIFGTYLMYPGEESYINDSREMQINLFDYSFILQNDIPPDLSAFCLSQNADVAQFLASVITSVGADPSSIASLNLGLARTPFIPDLGQSKLSIINDLLEMRNCFSLQCDAYGNYYSHPYRPPKELPVAHSIVPGKDCIVLNTFRHSLDAQVPNRIIVVRKGDSREQDYVVVRENNSNSSPFSYANTGMWISKTEEISESGATDEAVNSKADRLLAEAEGVVSTEYEMRATPVSLGEVFLINGEQIATLENVDVDLFSPVMKIRVRWANV